MAIKKASYYSDEGPEIPEAGGDYGAPTPHAAKVNQHPFEAPSSGTGTGLTSDGFAATDNPKATRPANDVSSAAQTAANSALFDPRPEQWGQ